MATCTTRTLEGMYIFSNPPKAVAAPVSLKQIRTPSNIKNFRNSSISNYRSIYSPDNFISGRPLSGYWWREKKETYEQRINATPAVTPVERTTEDNRQGSAFRAAEKSSQDAICQTDVLTEENKGNATPVVHSSCQTTLVEEKCSSTPNDISEIRINTEEILAQVETTIQQQESDVVPLEVVSRLLSRSYIEEMMPNLISKFKESGFTENFNETENDSVLPWLMNEMELGLSRLEASYKLLNDCSLR